MEFSHRDVFVLGLENRLEQAYRRMAAPLARRRIRTLIPQRMPPFLVEALDFLFTGKLAADDKDRVRIVESLRAQLARQHELFPPQGTQPKPSPDGFAMAHRVSVPRPWGTFLYLCVKASRARRILEMGSGAGISGAYLSAAPSCESLITIEASASRAALAKSNLNAVGAPARVMHKDNDAALNLVFSVPGASFDLVYLDSAHVYDTTVRWVARVLPYLNIPGILILDDIHYSRGMYAAWQKILASCGFACALDLGRLGVCYWDGASTETQILNLTRYTGWFRK